MVTKTPDVYAGRSGEILLERIEFFKPELRDDFIHAAFRLSRFAVLLDWKERRD